MAIQRIMNIPSEIGESNIWYDSDDDQMVVQHVQDTNPILEQNKRDYCTDQQWGSEVANRVASIPLSIVLQWKKEGLDIFDNSPETQKKLMQKLNSNEYLFLRTRPGKL